MACLYWIKLRMLECCVLCTNASDKCNMGQDWMGR